MINILYILLVLLVVISFLALIAPKTYDISRTIIINKPLPQVFDFLKYLKNQSYWSPWEEKDPEMKKVFTGVDGEAGFISAWEGNKEVGMGEQEIISIVENEEVNTELRFYKPWKSQSDAFIKVEKVDEIRTKVTWGFSGENKIPMSIMMLFMNMDKMIGKDFEHGLNKMKNHLEK